MDPDAICACNARLHHAGTPLETFYIVQLHYRAAAYQFSHIKHPEYGLHGPPGKQLNPASF